MSDVLGNLHQAFVLTAAVVCGVHILIDFDAEYLFTKVDKDVRSPLRATIGNSLVTDEREARKGSLEKLHNRPLLGLVVAGIGFVRKEVDEATETVALVLLVGCDCVAVFAFTTLCSNVCHT
jgi:hypothetical protein